MKRWRWVLHEVSRSYTGEIAALRASNLGFKRDGKLIQVLVSEGDRVEAGESSHRLNLTKLSGDIYCKST